MKKLSTTLVALLCVATVFGQKQNKNLRKLDPHKKYEIATIGFYNLENFFDTINDPNNPADDEYLPNSAKHWNTDKYERKVDHLATVIDSLGTPADPNGVAMIGLAEVENQRVLEDLVNCPKLKPRGYKIIHYESLDHRGIDVALLYEPKRFKVLSSKPYHLYVNGKLFHTRDQLLVSGILEGEHVYVIVGHWPSRYGGEKRSMPFRKAAAQLGRKLVDSLQAINPNARIIYMGDLNDDPVSPSIKKDLITAGKFKDMTDSTLYNPMEPLFKKGIGTLAYRDNWNLFDQIMFSKPFVTFDGYKSFEYYKAMVFNKPFVTQSTGNFHGYGFRTYSGNTYLGGYSDHFAVYVYLIKEIGNK